MFQLMPLTVSCFSKTRLVLPFWYRLTWVVPEKWPLNGCVCVSVQEKYASSLQQPVAHIPLGFVLDQVEEGSWLTYAQDADVGVSICVLWCCVYLGWHGDWTDQWRIERRWYEYCAENSKRTALHWKDLCEKTLPYWPGDMFAIQMVVLCTVAVSIERNAGWDFCELWAAMLSTSEMWLCKTVHLANGCLLSSCLSYYSGPRLV